MINITTSSRYKISRKDLKKTALRACLTYNIEERLLINIAFVGKIKMKAVSLTYKHEDVALPVLSFPYKGEQIENHPLLGEVVICYPQAVLLAAERNKTVDDVINALVIHGIENLTRK